MKWFLPLIFLLPAVCVGQDYQTIRSDFVHFFTYEMGWSTTYRGLKIDSIESIGNDSVFYNYKVLRSNDGFQTFEAYVPSWLGEKVIVKPNGDNLLFNSYGDTIFIQTQAQILDTWNLFQLDSSIFLEARVEGIGNETVLDSLVEVKIIGLQAKGIQGQPVNHPMNGKTIAISKSLGIILGFDFHLFPEDTSQIEIVGMENPDRGVHRLTWGEIYDFHVGDEFHTEGEETEWFNSPPIYRKTIDRVIGVTNGSNEVTVDFEYYWWRNAIPWWASPPHPYEVETGYSQYSRTYSSLSAELTTTMPNEATMILDTSGEYASSDFVSLRMHESGRQLVGFDGNLNDPGWILTGDNTWEVAPTLSGYYHTISSYAKGIGRTYYSFQQWDGGQAYADQNSWLVYYKKGAEEWGIPYSMSLILGEHEQVPSVLVAYPNPVKIGQLVRLSVDPKSTVRLFSADGKQIPVELQNGIMPTNGLVPGIYLLRVESASGVSTQNLVVTN